MRLFLVCFAAVSLLAACEPFPDLTAVESAGVDDAPYPELLTVDVLAAPAPETRASDEEMEDLQARADALSGAAQ